MEQQAFLPLLNETLQEAQTKFDTTSHEEHTTRGYYRGQVKILEYLIDIVSSEKETERKT